MGDRPPATARNGCGDRFPRASGAAGAGAACQACALLETAGSCPMIRLAKRNTPEPAPIRAPAAALDSFVLHKQHNRGLAHVTESPATGLSHRAKHDLRRGTRSWWDIALKSSCRSVGVECGRNPRHRRAVQRTSSCSRRDARSSESQHLATPKRGAFPTPKSEIRARRLTLRKTPRRAAGQAPKRRAS